MDPKVAISSAIHRINQTTMKGGSDDIRPLFHPDVVFVSPDFKQRVHGRDACLRTYEEFTSRAIIHAFSPHDPDIHVIGGTAVASTPFEIRYAMDGTVAEESGRDLMVFSQIGQQWAIIWRTVVQQSP